MSHHPGVVEECSYGKNCKKPATELLIPCSASCSKRIHPSCASIERCPWCMVEHDTQRTLGALVPCLPSANPTLVANLQSLVYQTAIIKNDERFLSQTKKVKTIAGDSVLVVDGPKDGNCLIAAFVRGLVGGGRPLSPRLEQQAIEELRGILSKVILDHTWPHPDVASPQSIIQCAEETARNGGWCGEVAMAAFASITGTCLKLYRYVNDEKKCDIIEPLMNWNINEGDGDDRRPVLHLLQTRLPLPGQPEHCSHWEILIMVPPEPAPVGIEYGPIIVDNKDSTIECYEYILNRNVSPHLEVKQWCKYKIKGRGKKPSMERVVCQIQRKITTKRNQSPSYGPIQIKMFSNDGALSIVTKSINEIESPTIIPISDIDLKEIKSLWTKATAPPPVIVVPQGPAGAPRKRKRTPSISALSTSNENSSTSSNQNSPPKAKPKTKRPATPKKVAAPKFASKSRARANSRSSSSSSSSSSSGSESDGPGKQPASAEKKTLLKQQSQPKRQLATQTVRPEHLKTHGDQPRTGPPTCATPENPSFSTSSVEARMSQLESNVNRLIQLVTPVVNVPLQGGVQPPIVNAVPPVVRANPTAVYGNGKCAVWQPDWLAQLRHQDAINDYIQQAQDLLRFKRDCLFRNSS